jgi:putative inorganic carbon (hco3(-)) transporter
MRKLLFIVTVVYTIFLITRPHEFIPGLAEVPLLQPMVLGAFAIWLAMPNKGLDLPQFRTLPILLVFVWLSLGFAGWWGGIVPAVEKLLPPMLLFVIVSGCVRSVSELKKYSTVVIACACVLVLHGHFQVTTGIGWTGQPMIEGRITYSGIFNDPNDMGLLIVMSIAMSLFHFRTRENVLARVAILAALGWLLYGVYLTDSRGTMLATMLVLGLEVWRSYGRTVVIALGALLVPVLFAFTRLAELDAEEESAANRFDAWYEGIEMLMANPGFGVGWGMFSDYHGLTAHNSVVLAMAELGLFGYTVWLSFVALTGWMIYRLVFPAKPRATPKPAFALAAGTVPWANGARAAVAAGHVARTAAAEVAATAPVSRGVVGRGRAAVSQAVPVVPDQELERLAAMFVLFAASGFALGAFFLSQSYKAMIFLNCGLIVGRYLGMREAGMLVPTYFKSMKLPLMFGVALASVVVLWILLKFLL